MFGAKLLSFAAVIALAAARPEQYREKEDFQYSRSSTDEGSKSGFFSAQDGNMGGNYKKTHNMDDLANTQLDTVRYGVDGALSQFKTDGSGSSFGVADTKGRLSSFDSSSTYGRGLHGSGYNQQYNQGFANSGHYASDYRKSESQRENYAQSAGSLGGQRYISTYNPSLYHSDTGYYGNYQRNNLLAVETVTQVPSFSEKNHESEYKYEKEWEKHSGGSDLPAPVIPLSRTDDAVWYKQQNEEALKMINQQHQNLNSQYRGNYGYGSALSHQNQLTGSGAYEKGYEDRSHYDSTYSKPLVVNPLSTYSQNLEAESLGGSELNKEYEKVEESKYKKEWERRYGSQSHQALGASSQRYGALVSNQQEVAQVAKPKKYESSYAYHKSWEKHGDPYIIQPVPEKIISSDAIDC